MIANAIRSSSHKIKEKFWLALRQRKKCSEKRKKEKVKSKRTLKKGYSYKMLCRKRFNKYPANMGEK